MRSLPWGDLLTAYNGTAISYDEIGNPDGYSDRTFTWEHGRQLASQTKSGVEWTYDYDANGMRTKRSSDSKTYEYIYSGDKLVQMTITDHTTSPETVQLVELFYDAAGQPLAMALDGVLYYYVLNIQGDVMGMVDSSGNLAISYNYEGYGAGYYVYDTSDMTDTLLSTNPLLYRSYVLDTGTGLYYLQSRYYDPEMGRFINADSATSTGQGIIGCNMFSYCLNNPANGCDPCGTCFHRWDFWNDCEKCGGETIHEKLEDTNFVVSSGYFGSLNVGAFNITGTIECASDLKGNMQLFSTVSFDVTTTGGFSVSVGSTDTMLFAPDTSFLSGDSYYLGGGVTCPIPKTQIAGSSMDNILRTADGYWGTNSTTGICFPSYTTKLGGEVHGGYSYTKKWTKQFNIFNALDKFVEWYLSK